MLSHGTLLLLQELLIMCKSLYYSTQWIFFFFCSKVNIFSDFRHFQSLGSVREQVEFFLKISVQLLSRSCLAHFLMPKSAQSGPQMLLQRDDRSSTSATSVAMSQMSENMH